MAKIKMDMTKGNILRQIILFSLPLVATSLIHQLFNTAVSQWVACFMVRGYMMKSDGLCKFEWKKLGIHCSTFKSILAIGIPSGIQSSMFAIGNTVMQTALNSFNSSVYVSESSISSNVGTYTQMICGGFVQATQVFVGQNTGARNMERIRKGVRFSLLVTVLSSIVLNLVSGSILGAFAPGNAEVVEFAKIKLVIFAAYGG